jgi:hypothetical protein
VAKRKNKIIVLIAAVASIFGAVFFYLDTQYIYNEKFQIGKIEATLFKLDKSYSSPECPKLLMVEKINDTSSEYFIGLRFSLKYLSLRKEHIWSKSNRPDGASGHIDSLVNISIFYGNEGSDNILITPFLRSANECSYFRLDSIFLNNHSAHGLIANCYKAEIFSSISEFISYYNNSADFSFVPYITNYHLFKLDSTIVLDLSREWGKVRANMVVVQR